jgi:ADP-heptose:LPS heptosyltransferase
MRKVDFWAGIPICFLLTLVHRVGRFLGVRSPANGEPPRRVLFIQLAEMGTMVVAYPALRKMREMLPDAELHFLCFTEIRASLEILSAIPPGNVLTIESRSLLSLVRDTIGFAWAARRRGIDAVVNLETFVRYSSILSYLSGARRRVGFHRFNQEGLYTGDFLTHKVHYNPAIHAGHTFLDLVHALKAPLGQVPLVKRPRAADDLSVPKRRPEPAALEALWRRLRALNPEIGPAKRLVVLNPNASARFPLRRLPLKSYADLAKGLLEDPDVFVLITGVEDEKADAELICAHVGSKRALDLAGATTLSELLDLLSLARVLVTNDSGPAHLACLTDVHIVVFFGPELPSRYRPLTDRCDVVYSGFSCSPCVSPYNQRLTPCNDNLCMKTIQISEVCDLVRRRLQAEVH